MFKHTLPYSLCRFIYGERHHLKRESKEINIEQMQNKGNETACQDKKQLTYIDGFTLMRRFFPTTSLSVYDACISLQEFNACSKFAGGLEKGCKARKHCPWTIQVKRGSQHVPRGFVFGVHRAKVRSEALAFVL